MNRSKFSNRLINEASPYLLQHAHNSVDWFLWGAETFEKLGSENKPVLISIGYSAYHWCHVVESESSIPLLRKRNMIDSKPTAFVCASFIYQKPATTVEELAKQLLRKECKAMKKARRFHSTLFIFITQ